MGVYFSSLIKAARKKASLSQGDVSRKLGYTSPQFISNWERELSVVPAADIKPLSKILKLSPYEIIAALVDDYRIRLEEEI